jgi:hypothetical protein
VIALRIYTTGDSCPSCESATSCRSCSERPRMRGRSTRSHEVHVVEDYGRNCHCGEILVRRSSD